MCSCHVNLGAEAFGCRGEKHFAGWMRLPRASAMGLRCGGVAGF